MKRVLAVLAALATSASPRSAMSAPPRALEDPSRSPSRPASRVGWYMRAGLGVGYDSAQVLQRVETSSASTRGIGLIDGRHRGFGARIEGIGALRLRRALIGLAYVFGHTDTVSSTRPPAEGLGLQPARGREWWLLGPSGGVQLGRGPTWTLGGMVGWGKVRAAGFVPPEGTTVTTTPFHESMLGISVWAGPSWTLGRGWMLGVHARATAARSNLQLFGNPDTASEIALLAHISFQSP